MKVRISALNSFAKCLGLYVMQLGSSSGKAAQTGSLVGRMIELFHRAVEPEECLTHAYAEGLEKWPLADFDQARTWALAYMSDPRNRAGSELGEVVGEWQEMDVTMTEPFEATGHPDQVRRHPTGQLKVWDVKSGSPSGLDMVHSYAWQLAGYAVALTETLGEEVTPGGIIRVRGYTVRGGVKPANARVFFHTPWSLDRCRTMLDDAAFYVDQLAQGYVPCTPGNHCGYCPASGPANCAEEIGERNVS